MTQQPHKLNVQIKPNAKENKIIGWHNGHLKIAIKAIPVDGKANQTLVKFLAEYFDVPKSSINILRFHGFSRWYKGQYEKAFLDHIFLP